MVSTHLNNYPILLYFGCTIGYTVFGVLVIQLKTDEVKYVGKKFKTFIVYLIVAGVIVT